MSEVDEIAMYGKFQYTSTQKYINKLFKNISIKII